MTRATTGLAFIFCLACALTGLADEVAAGEQELKTYTHKEMGFSLDYPARLEEVPGRPDEETLPSQEFEWRFPGFQEGKRRILFLGFYDLPPEDQTIQSWFELGNIAPAPIGRGRAHKAFIKEKVSFGIFEKEYYIPDPKNRITILISFVAQGVERWKKRKIKDVRRDYTRELEVLEKMVSSFRVGKS